jgi:hypothetical protein
MAAQIADYALVNQRAARSSAVLRSTIPAFPRVHVML